MKKAYEEKNIQAIADKIREKTGTGTTYRTSEMPNGVEEVYEKGYSQSELDFWNVVVGENHGTSNDKKWWFYAFTGWQCEYFRPPFKITPMGSNAAAYGTFQYCANLKKIEKQYFDFSHVKTSPTAITYSYTETFRTCSELEEIEDIGMPPNYYRFTYRYSPKLKKIEIIRVTKECKFENPFGGCTALEEIRWDGEIGESLTLATCSNLSMASAIDTISHLYNYSGSSNEFTKTITFHEDTKTALDNLGEIEELEGKTAEKYIEDICWSW